MAEQGMRCKKYYVVSGYVPVNGQLRPIPGAHPANSPDEAVRLVCWGYYTQRG